MGLSWIFASITDLSSIHPQIILNLSNNDVDVLWASSCIILHSSRNMSHTHTTAHVEFTHKAAQVQISSIYNLCFMMLLRPIVFICKYTPELTIVAKLMNCLVWEREALTFDVFLWLEHYGIDMMEISSEIIDCQMNVLNAIYFTYNIQ